MADKRTSPLVSSSPSLGQLHDLEAARKELKRKMVALLAEEKAAKRARAKLLARARCLSEGDLAALLWRRAGVSAWSCWSRVAPLAWRPGQADGVVGGAETPISARFCWPRLGWQTSLRLEIS